MKKGIIIFTILLIASYIILQIVVVNSQGVKTEPVRDMTIEDTIDARCIILRDEEVLNYDGEGVLSYLIDDGCKVSNNGIIANIYKSEDDKKLNSSINKINKEISRLDELSKKLDSSSITFNILNKRIYSNLNRLSKEMLNDNYSDIDSIKNDMLCLINTKQMMVGEEIDCRASINGLISKRDELMSRSCTNIGEVRAPKSGYFTTFVDGYEKLFDYNNAKSLNLHDVCDMINRKISKSDKSNSVIGKIINDPTWYIVGIIPVEKVKKLYMGQVVEVNLPFAFPDSVPCTVSAINMTKGNNECVVSFSCNMMSKEILFLRNEKILINIDKHSGIGIKKSALHEDVLKKEFKDESGNVTVEEKKVKGVYVSYGGILTFKEVKIIYSSDDYMICDPAPREGELFMNETIRPFDEVVISGTELYNGKTIRT